MNKRVECECGWTSEGAEEVILERVREHCTEAHQGRVPDRDQILAAARPVDPHDAT
jgi:hypothetical protein